MVIKLRIEQDKGITKLLKKHPKYGIEYDLNVFNQGYESLILAQFNPVFIHLAISYECLNLITKSLKELTNENNKRN